MFTKRFNYILEADEEQQAPTPDTDQEALASTLDTAKPEDFNVKIADRQKRVDHVKIEQITSLEKWIADIDSFIEGLNGTTTGESIQSQLHAAPCDSLFEEIARSQKKKISRLAADLSAFSETLKGYLTSAND